MRSERCGYCERHGPATLALICPVCGDAATHRILWVDGQWSPACDLHGVEVLDAVELALVHGVVGGARHGAALSGGGLVEAAGPGAKPGQVEAAGLGSPREAKEPAEGEP